MIFKKAEHLNKIKINNQSNYDYLKLFYFV